MTTEKYILVVEDDADIRDCMVEILSSLGYVVKTAENGKIALELLRRNPLPALVLLDLRMPVMGGREFCEVRNSTPALQNLPIVLMSAETDLLHTAKELKANAYFAKPVQVDSLLKVIQNVYVNQANVTRFREIKNPNSFSACLIMSA